MPEQREPASAAADVRRAYETEGVYSVSTICRKMHDGARDYVDELLADKLETVKRNMQPGLIVDLCCGTGDHLFALCPPGRFGLGLDFSRPFIEKAVENSREKPDLQVDFAVADAARLPLPDSSVGTLYCLSALYQVPGIESAFAEVGRVLAPGGRAVLDLGNTWSINAICNRAYPEIPPLNTMSVSRMTRLCQQNRLALIEHRAFQILPLWASKPIWLWPLLRPGWKKIMKKRVRGRMIDEWISGSRLFRRFAFRHLLVVERRGEV